MLTYLVSGKSSLQKLSGITKIATRSGIKDALVEGQLYHVHLNNKNSSHAQDGFYHTWSNIIRSVLLQDSQSVEPGSTISTGENLKVVWAEVSTLS